jgi:hypothetical protein
VSTGGEIRLNNLEIQTHCRPLLKIIMEKTTCTYWLAAILLLTSVASTKADNSEVQARDGTLTLSGGNNNNNMWTSALYLIPVLFLIVVLDFAIFGTFASRSDELNPVSRFFFHARNGLAILRHRRRNSNQAEHFYRQQR